MGNFKAVMAAGTLALFAVSYPGFAQEARQQQGSEQEAQQTVVEEDNYVRLLGAIQSDKVLSAAADSAILAMMRLVLNDVPELAEIARSSTELQGDFIARFHPLFLDHIMHGQVLILPRQIAILQDAMTAEESGRLADFYSTDLGQRLLLSTIQNLSYDHIVANESLDDPITQEDYSADINQAAKRTAQDFEPTLADRKALLRLAADPAFTKFNNAQAELQALNVENENRPLPPETEAKIAEIFLSILDDYTPEM